MFQMMFFLHFFTFPKMTLSTKIDRVIFSFMLDKELLLCYTIYRQMRVRGFHKPILKNFIRLLLSCAVEYPEYSVARDFYTKLLYKESELMKQNQIMEIGGIEYYEKDNIVYLKLETCVRGLGFTKTDVKVSETGFRKEYVRIDWPRVDTYLERLGFGTSAERPEFIPENIFYRLAMKAKNEVAEVFQAKVADEIIPQIRRTGTYSIQSIPVISEEEKQKLNIETAAILERIANDYTGTYRQILQAHAVKALTGEMLLPLPKLEKPTYSASEIGKMLGVSSKKVGAIANKHNLKKDIYGQWFKDKSPHSNKEVSAFRYYDDVIPVIKSLLN